MGKATKGSGRSGKRGWWTAGAIVLGLALATGSFFLYADLPWWSNILANAAVVILLLIPGEWILSRLNEAIVQVDAKATAIGTTATEARIIAEEARESAEQTALSLEDVRRSLIDRQHEELSEEKDFYASLVSDPRRENITLVLRTATDAGLITSKGVRAPIWWTDLHYRYVLGTADDFSMNIETDDGSILHTERWPEDEPPEVFFQRLVEAVRAQGADLGTGLNDPTESLERVSEMLVEVVRLRSQDPLGHRHTLKNIIERRDDWYFTERLFTSPSHHGYSIAIDRLNEIDWEQHLYDKGWGDGVDAIQFARRLYGVAKAK